MAPRSRRSHPTRPPAGTAAAVLATALVAVGCGRLGYDSADPERDDRADGGPVDGGRDGGALTEDCPVVAAPDDVFHFTFDGADGEAPFVDRTGRFSARSPGGGGLDRIPGPAGCGEAIAFDGRDGWLHLDDDPAFDLVAGSLELMLRPGAATVDRGVLSRDASGTAQPGHLSLFALADGRLVARLQSRGGTVSTRCTDGPVDADTWHHVRLRFGASGFGLEVDGSPANAVGRVRVRITNNEASEDCGGEATSGIAGNDLPWVFGAARNTTPADAVEAAQGTLVGGAIDEVRLSPGP